MPENREDGGRNYNFNQNLCQFSGGRKTLINESQADNDKMIFHVVERLRSNNCFHGSLLVEETPSEASSILSTKSTNLACNDYLVKPKSNYTACIRAGSQCYIRTPKSRF